MGNLPAGTLPSIDSAFNSALSNSGRIPNGFMGGASLAAILNGTPQLPFASDLTPGGQIANPGSAPWSDGTNASSIYTPPTVATYATSTWTPPSADTNGASTFTLGGTGGVYIATINLRTLDVGFHTSIAQSCTDLAAVINSGGSFSIGAIVGGPFQLGETVTSSSGGSATLTGIISPLTVSGVTGTFHSGDVITGGTSLATATASQNLQIVSDVVTAVAGGTTVAVTAKASGTAGNGITTAASHTGAATMSVDNASTSGGADTTVVINGVSFLGNFITSATATVTAVKALIAASAPTLALVGTSGTTTLVLTAVASGTAGNGITTTIGGTATSTSAGSFSGTSTTGGNDTLCVIDGISFLSNFVTSADATLAALIPLIQANATVSALVTVANVSHQLVVTAVASGTDGNGITTTVGGTAHGASFNHVSTTGGAGTTLNSVAGRVVMGTGNQYLILNNNLVGANTIIQPTIETVDGTLTSVTPIPGAPGQVLFAGNATATGNTTIGFTLINPLVG